MPVSKELVMTVGNWLSCGWRPGPPVRRSGVRGLLSFGANLTLFNVATYLTRSVDRVLIGRFSGATMLGLYDTANRLVLLPLQQFNTPLTSVAVPTLSRLTDQPERFRAYYRRGVMLVVAAGMPLVAFLFVAAERAVPALLGQQWIDSVPIFRALAPAAYFGTFSVATAWVFVSYGQTRRQLKWGIFASVVTLIGFAIGIRWGAIGVALAFSTVVVALRIPAAVYCFKEAPTTITDLGSALWRPMIASLAAAAALYGLQTRWQPELPQLTLLLLDFVAYATFYILIWVALPRGVRSAKDLITIARELRPGSQ
jgi:O-antigen/teichoic acid export membrane protein